jgi:hypothetical protein
MDWEQTTAEDGLQEWTRADRNATIRLRQRTDGQFTVRLDQLYQADEGRGYDYEVLESREAAEQLVAEWQADAVPTDEPPE